MKKLLLITVLFSSLFFSAFSLGKGDFNEEPQILGEVTEEQTEQTEEAAAQNSHTETNKGETEMTKTIKIEGMMCPHCQGRVEKALNALEGVTAVVDLEAGTAAVTLTGAVSDEALRQAVTDAGYEVTSIA